MQKVIKNLPLRAQTSPKWIEAVKENFHLFLADHAANERKAAASAMALVVQYPDRISLVETASRIAEEELRHFRQVFRRMRKMGAPLLPDEKDPYVGAFAKEIRSAGLPRLLDRLLVNSLIEMRGIERFWILATEFPDIEWRKFYDTLCRSEVGHGFAFIHEAEKIFEPNEIHERLDALLDVEAKACRSTPSTGRFH